MMTAGEGPKCHCATDDCTSNMASPLHEMWRVTVTEVAPIGSEWVMQQYKGPAKSLYSDLPDYYTTAGPAMADKCFDEHTGTGRQQSWKKLVGTYCFRMTAWPSLFDVCKDGFCTVQPFCSRGVESGTKLRFFKGERCTPDTATVEIPYQDHLTWPELAEMLSGTCKNKHEGMEEKWLGRKSCVPGVTMVGCEDDPIKKHFILGADFPDCYGYDYSTQGAGVITADPKDSPYTLQLYMDNRCEAPYEMYLTNNNPLVGVTWFKQRWMSALRKVDSSQRIPSLDHCWHIEEGLPDTMRTVAEGGSIKIKCKQMNDARQGYYVQTFADANCFGPTGAGEFLKEEIFFMELEYEELASGQASVDEITQLFGGTAAAPERVIGPRNAKGAVCAFFGQFEEESTGEKHRLYWSFDRPVYGEDWPNCYEEALTERIQVRRPIPGDSDYKGSIGTIRKSATGAAAPRAHSNFVMSALLAALTIAIKQK